MQPSTPPKESGVQRTLRENPSTLEVGSGSSFRRLGGSVSVKQQETKEKILTEKNEAAPENHSPDTKGQWVSLTGKSKADKAKSSTEKKTSAHPFVFISRCISHFDCAIIVSMRLAAITSMKIMIRT